MRSSDSIFLSFGFISALSKLKFYFLIIPSPQFRVWSKPAKIFQINFKLTIDKI